MIVEMSEKIGQLKMEAADGKQYHANFAATTFDGKTYQSIIHLMQDMITGKKRVTPLLTEPQEAGA